MTIDNVKLTVESVSDFFKTSVKRDTPIKLGIEDLFHTNETDSYKPFSKSAFIDYYKCLTDEYKLNLQYLFQCISENVQLSCKVKENTNESNIHISVCNHFHQKSKFDFKVANDEYLKGFIFDYCYLKISCDVTLERILTYLGCK